MKKEQQNLDAYVKAMSMLFVTPKGICISLATSVMAYFSPIWMILLVICIFVVVDLITGILAARKLKKEIKSKCMRASVTKMLCYFLTIVLAFFIQKEIIKFDWFQIMNLAGGIIALAEFKSILENFGVLTNNKVFKNIFKQINDIFKKKTEEVTQIKKEE